MSLTPAFAADANLQWRDLDPQRQEIVLDLLDRLASNPPSSGEHVVDDVRQEHGIQYRLEEKEIEALDSALEAKGIFPKRDRNYLKFTTEKDSLAKYPDEHKKLLLGLYAKDLKKKV